MAHPNLGVRPLSPKLVSVQFPRRAHHIGGLGRRRTQIPVVNGIDSLRRTSGLVSVLGQVRIVHPQRASECGFGAHMSLERMARATDSGRSFRTFELGCCAFILAIEVICKLNIKGEPTLRNVGPGASLTLVHLSHERVEAMHLHVIPPLLLRVDERYHKRLKFGGDLGVGLVPHVSGDSCDVGHSSVSWSLPFITWSSLRRVERTCLGGLGPPWTSTQQAS